MILDSRIIKGKKPLTPFDVDEAREYIGKDCYFTSQITDFDSLDRYGHKIKKGKLTSIFNNDQDPDPYCHHTEDELWCESFIVPCEWVQKNEKKFRPYTLMEFTDKFPVGLPIKFREKGKFGCERYLILDGYVHDQRNGHITTFIYIGSYPYTLDELFNGYEWQEHYTEDFKPFGVEE